MCFLPSSGSVFSSNTPSILSKQLLMPVRRVDSLYSILSGRKIEKANSTQPIRYGKVIIFSKYSHTPSATMPAMPTV